MGMEDYTLERKIEQLHRVIGELNLILTHEFKGREITEEIKRISTSIASLDHSLMSQLIHINLNMEKKLEAILEELKLQSEQQKDLIKIYSEKK